MSDEQLKQFPENKTLYFGLTNGVGTEENPFRLYWCSKKALNNWSEFSKTDHLDCTYKILKYGFPVLVDGFTDINREFHPGAFGVQSHEREVDFDHYQQAFKKLCTGLCKCFFVYFFNLLLCIF